MRRASLVLATLLLFLSDAEACGRRGRVARRHCQPDYSPQVVYHPQPAYHPQPNYQSQPVNSPQVVYQPQPAYQSQPLAAPEAFSFPQPAASAPPTAWTPVSPPPQAASTIQPMHDYTAATTGQRRAYYYSYDSSGKLIIQQWMDFLFRGGKEAGMPRPPLPIVGRLKRN